MQAAELVSVRVAEIGEIQLPESAFAIARWFLARRAARFDAAPVPGIDLFGALEVEPDGSAIGVMRRLAIDGPGHHEHRPALAIGEPALVVLLCILLEQRIIELL